MLKTSAFRPAWWLSGPHLQTIWPVVFRARPKLEVQRTRFELPDGDFVDLDWTTGTSLADDSPVVLVLHGLAGSIESKYARGILAAIRARGWRGVLMHFRGCSGEPNRRAQSYHSGQTEDPRAVLAHLAGLFPKAPLGAVGYSLGGNVLLKYLGEEGPASRLEAAVAVSVPLSLSPCSRRLQRGLSRVYDRWLLLALQSSLRHKSRAVALAPEIAAVGTAWLDSIRTFDERVTAVLHGFRDAEDYYERSSSRPYLARITTPTLILHAKDDPFMTDEVIPSEDELGRAVEFELSDGGGHVGFVEGPHPLAARYWLESRIPEFLAPRLARAAQTKARGGQDSTEAA